MKFLATQPNGAKFAQDHYGVAIEAYLLGGDTNEERKKARCTTLEVIAQNANASPTEKSHADNLMHMLRQFPGGLGHGSRLKYVAEKIDLAALVRD